VTQEPAGADATGPDLHRALARRYPRRRPARAVRVLGAGSDDRKAGRELLALLDRHGHTVESAAEALVAFEVPDFYPFAVGLDLVAPVLAEYGTRAQRARWLPPLRAGAEIWCQLFSEPGAGSDLAAVSTHAVRVGDGWRLAGQKVWTSRAHYARWGLLLARTDPAVPKHAGITCFALDMCAPGVEVRPLRQMNGDDHFCEVFLDDAPVPDRDRIGAVSQGWAVALRTLAHERSALAGRTGGTVASDQLLRVAHGRGGGHDGVMRDQLARAVVTLKIQELARARSAALARQGRPEAAASGEKICEGAAVRAAAAVALDLKGPEGALAADDAWSTLFLTGPSLSIRGGTDEIQRSIVGERVLGLPPEPRVDKTVPFAETRR
jgi:alkylation response protein AidB-like acyl-CoA dehydrogenase